MVHPLTGKQKRFLRAKAHELKPVITIGKNEISAALTKETKQQLQAHELIKVKGLELDEDRKAVFAQLAEQTGSELVQVIGKIAVLYKKRAEDPEIVLPAVRKNLE